MTSTANASQFDAWNGENGRRWVAAADQRDAVLAPVGAALLAAAAPAQGERVLDLGCGCGATTLLAAAVVGATGRATGADISDPMLEVARSRAATAGVPNVEFMQADAQTHPFTKASADLVMSRFGTMFFSDQIAAFTNIRTAVRSDGRLCLATWRPLDANEWLLLPTEVLSRHAEPPPIPVDGPSMFGQSDRDTVVAQLVTAGFADVSLDAVDISMDLGSIDDTVEYLAGTGVVRAYLDVMADEPAREAALADLRGAVSDRADAGTVSLVGGIWIVHARV